MGNILRRMSETLKHFLLSRHRAYQLTFNKDDLANQAVLKDLAKFCRANDPTFHQDPRAHALLEGRREVWLRIAKHLALSPQEYLELYGGNE